MWFERLLSEDDVSQLGSISNLVVDQKTPMRVMHRRSIASRAKVIHWARVQLLDSHCVKLWLCTQAGTYIKEFIHGDFGRTTPNIGTLLNSNVDILSLDVVAVNLSWPPRLAD